MVAVATAGGGAIAAGKGAAVSFTASQAGQGETAYENDCAQCHGANLEGYSGPALTGTQFQETYSSVSALLGFVTTNMPYNAPGSLAHDEYVTIVAFILSKNGVAAGNTALTYEAAMASKTAIWPAGK